MRTGLTILILMCAASVVHAQTYEQRHTSYFDDISTRGINLTQTSGPHRAGRTGFWTTQGKLQRGNMSSGVWSQLKTTITNADGAEDAGGANGGFSGWPGMDTYLRWQHLMPQDVKDAYMAEYLGMATYGSGSTPNQRMMWAAACRLACETWGTAAVTSKSNASNKTGEITGKQYIETVCDRTVRYNFDERWAKHYLQYTLGPLRSIADLSTDPALANKARMTWNWGWMDIASFSFKGRWAIPAGRGGMTQDGNSSDISEHGSWLMFGGTNRADTLDYDQVLNYTQPPVGQPNVITQPPILPEMLEAATDRSRPFTRRGLARVHETQFATTYMTNDWALYSQLEGDTTLNTDGTIKIQDLNNNGVPSNDWSSERWAVMWDETGPAGLTMKPPTGYGWAQGSGLGPYEDVVQHEGTLVGIINIPATWTWQYTNDNIPTNTTAVINDSATTGRLFLHYSKVLVAITRSDIGNFTWPPAAQTTCSKRGFAVECASLSEYPQSTAAARLAAFKADIVGRPADVSHVNDATPRMIYTTRAGTVLDITFGQGGTINGSPVDYEGWPLNESPWSYQSQMGNMWVFGQDRHQLWNYKTWTEQQDRRPTATTTAAVVATGAAPVDVDLSTRVADAETAPTALKYHVTNATNGTAQLLADGRTVRFSPAANQAGPSTFTFTAGGAFPDHRFICYHDYESTNLGADASTNDRHASMNIGGIASATGTTDVPAVLMGVSTKALRLTSGAFGSAKLSRQIHPATLNLSNHEWTFATWVKRESYADDDFIFYIGDGDGFGGNGDELQVWLPAQSKTVAVRHYNAANTETFSLSSAAKVEVGEWHHVAVHFARTGHNTGVVELYLDGELVATSASVTWALKQASPVFIGGPALNTVLTRNFSGWLDDTVLARGGFNADEIAQLARGSAAYLGGAKLTQTVMVNTTVVAPSGLSATAGVDAIVLAWSPASGATSYTVKRGTTSSGPFTTVVSGLSATSFADASAAFGTLYFYIVTATNAAGESGNSNVASTMLPASDPTLWSTGIMNAWSHAARITCPGYTRSETLTNFPLLVRLDAVSGPGFSYSQMASNTGADLRFTDATGTTLLNFEMEKWDTAGTSLVWVQVPSLVKGGSIIAFWGNAAATLPASSTNGATWSNGYTGVWHLNSTLVSDSTATPQNTTSNATVTGAGKVSSALVHNGTSQHAIIPNADELNLPNNYELSGWFKLAATDKPASGDYRTLFTKETDSNTRNWWLAIKSDGKLWWKSSAGIDITSPSDLADGQWHYIAAVHDGSTARLYLDGVEAATDAAPVTEELTTFAIRLGSENATRWFKGMLDEFRVSNVMRSAAWERTVFDNINDPASFQRCAPVTTYAATFAPIVSTRPASNVTSTTASLNGTLSTTGGSTTTVIIYHGSTDGGTNPSAWAGALNLGPRSVGNFSGAISGLPAGTTRYCRAFASNTTGGTWAAETVSFVTDATAPTGLTASSIAGTVSLAWNASTGASTYHVKRSTVSGGPFTTILADVVGTTAVDATATPGSAYFYIVTAVNSGGESASSAELSVQTLAASSTLNATAGNASVALSWSTVSGAMSYTVKRATTSGGPYSMIQSGIVGTSFTDSTAINGTSYHFIVTAQSANAESASSIEASATPSASMVAPVGLIGTPSNASAQLTWSAVPGAESYRVKRATTSGGPYSNVASGLLAPSFTNGGLANGTAYFFVVSAVNGSIESANSAEVSVTPGATPTVFTSGSAGLWSTAAWSPQPPISAFQTNIVFNNASSITSSANLGVLLANKLDLTSAAVTLSGDSLFLAGTSPAITTTGNVAHNIANPLSLDTATTLNIAQNATTLSGPINGSGGIIKTGAGSLIITGANTYTGTTSVSAGALNVRHSSALGSGAVTVANGAVLELQGGINIADERVTITGSGSNGALLSKSGHNIWAGDITALASSGIVRIGCDADSLTLSGEIAQPSSSTDQLVFQGNGNIIVTSAMTGSSRVTRSTSGTGVVSLIGDNTYTGQTLLNGGVTEVDSVSSLVGDPGDEEVALNSSSLGAPQTVANGTINMGNGSTTATLRFTGPSIKTDRVVNLAGISGGAIIEQAGTGLLTFLSGFTATGAGSKTLTLTGTGNGVIAGAIVDNSSTNKTSVTKSGLGTWELRGAHAYAGATTVNAGRLVVSGTFTSAITAAAGTLAVQGTPSTTSNLTITSNGRLETTLTPLSVDGSVSLAGTLDVVAGPDLAAGTYIVINKTSLGAMNGTFAGRAEGSVFTEGGHTFQITYQGGDGNDLALTKLSPIEIWRFNVFSTISNTGASADNADVDHDGVVNLLEYALAMNATTSENVSVAATKIGSTLEFIYTKNKSATDVTYTVEWSDDLVMWSTAGVTSSVLNDGTTTQQIKALVPAGLVRRFVHLKVTNP